MLSAFFSILGIYVVVRTIWRIITFPFRRAASRCQKRYYYDEFDWWQDNQGF